MYEVRLYLTAREIIMAHFKPGQKRRSLIGMIGTVGEWAAVLHAEKEIAKTEHVFIKPLPKSL